MKRLVVDDDRDPNFQAIVARPAQEALAAIISEPWDEVWLDHDNDLAPGHDYSWVTARIRDMCMRGTFPDVGLFVLHSANRYGRRNQRNHLGRWFRCIDVESYPEKGLRLEGVKTISVSTDKGVERVQSTGPTWNLPLQTHRRFGGE